jgi:hypothetical protein
MRHYHEIYARVQQRLHSPTMKGVWCDSSKADESEQTMVYSQMKMDQGKEMRIQNDPEFLLPVPSLAK